MTAYFDVLYAYWFFVPHLASVDETVITLPYSLPDRSSTYSSRLRKPRFFPFILLSRIFNNTMAPKYLMILEWRKLLATQRNVALPQNLWWKKQFPWNPSYLWQIEITNDFDVNCQEKILELFKIPKIFISSHKRGIL